MAKRSKRKKRKQKAPSQGRSVEAETSRDPGEVETPDEVDMGELEEIPAKGDQDRVDRADQAGDDAPLTEPEHEPEHERKDEPISIRAAAAGLTAFYLHLHPRLVRRRSAGAGATLGLGLATLFSLLVATLSGILLMFYYVPSVERAHASIQDMMAIVPFGKLLRNLHRWSAHATVLCCLLHMLRTLLWGAYRGTHRRVWLVGVGLLVVTLATSFSGYLLPWDQDAYWTVTVGTSLLGYVPLLGDWLKQALLGGAEVGQPALTRFFVLHVVALPAAGLLLLLLHLFRLRRAGGLARPRSASGPDEELVPASPLVTGRQLALFLLCCVLLLLVSIFLDARLGTAPDLLRPDNPPKAPWFLVGLQEMVSYSALWGGFVYPTLVLGLLALGPWLDGGRECDGAPLPGRTNRLAIGGTVLLAGGAAVISVIWWGDPQHGSASWVNPATIASTMIAGVALMVWVLRRDRSLAYRTLIAGLLVVLTLFTLVGWFYRGPDWTLTYHPGPGHAHPEANDTPSKGRSR